MERVVLTGATGFIGSHIAEYFCVKGIPPTCLVRNPDRADFLRTLPVRLVAGDVTREEDAVRLCDGAELLIHAAGHVSDWGPWRSFYDVNVTGTENMLHAAVRAGVKHVILTGTNSCYGEESSTEVKTEESPYRPHYPYFLDRLLPSGLNHYRDTKALGNERAMEIAARHDLDLTILEPVWVYGERELHTGFYEYLKTVKSGIPFFPGSASNRFHTIYVRDIARLYYLAAVKRPRGVQRYIAADPDAENQRALFTMFCEAAGLRVPRMLPKALVYPPALLMEAAAMLFRRPRSPLLTRAIVNVFYDNIEYSSARAQRELHFAPAYTREESIRRTVTWYLQHNLL